MSTKSKVPRSARKAGSRWATSRRSSAAAARRAAPTRSPAARGGAPTRTAEVPRWSTPRCRAVGASGRTPTPSTSHLRRSSSTAAPSSRSRSRRSSSRPRASSCSASSPRGRGRRGRGGRRGRVDRRHAVQRRRARLPGLALAARRGEHANEPPTPRTLRRRQPERHDERGPDGEARATRRGTSRRCSKGAGRRARARACTRGASGVATSSSTASSRRRPRSPTPASRGATSQFVSGADTMRNGYPGYVAGATFAQALGWTGAGSRRRTRRARRAPRRSRPPAPRSSPGCATSRSSSAPTPRRRASSRPTPATGPTTPTGCASGCSARPTRPTSRSTPAAAWSCTARPTRTSPRSRSRTPRHGLANPYARYRKEVTVDDVLASPMVSDPLRLLEICATSDGGAAIVLSQLDYAPAARHADPGAHRARSRRSRRRYPEHDHRAAELRDRLRRRSCAVPERSFKDSIADAAYEEAGLGPEDLDRRRGLRPVDRARARLVRGHRPLRAGRGREAAARRRHDARRPHPGQPERRARLLRRGGPRPGDRAGVRARPGSSGARPAAARSRAPRSGSPSTRACSATAPRCCSSAELTEGPSRQPRPDRFSAGSFDPQGEHGTELHGPLRVAQLGTVQRFRVDDGKAPVVQV